MPVAENELYDLLTASFPTAQILLEDLVGDGDHWSAVITAAEFAGQSRIAQHRMVNLALESILGTRLHALKIQTYPLSSTVKQ